MAKLSSIPNLIKDIVLKLPFSAHDGTYRYFEGYWYWTTVSDSSDTAIGTIMVHRYTSACVEPIFEPFYRSTDSVMSLLNLVAIRHVGSCHWSIHSKDAPADHCGFHNNHNVSIYRSKTMESGSWEFVGLAAQCQHIKDCKILYRPHLVVRSTVLSVAETFLVYADDSALHIICELCCSNWICGICGSVMHNMTHLNFTGPDFQITRRPLRDCQPTNEHYQIMPRACRPTALR